jgi:hypothetical protein
VTGIEICSNVKEPEQIGGTDAFLDLSDRIDVIVDCGGARYVPVARGLRVQRPTQGLQVIREEIGRDGKKRSMPSRLGSGSNPSARI